MLVYISELSGSAKIRKASHALAQSFFPLSPRREDTFVAGLSMGGYGALKWALRSPQRFAAAADEAFVAALSTANSVFAPVAFARLQGLGQAEPALLTRERHRIAVTEAILALLAALNADGMTIVVITHEEEVARRAGRSR